MSKTTVKINRIKNKLDNISGLDGKYVQNKLDDIENIIDSIKKHCDENIINGTIFE